MSEREQIDARLAGLDLAAEFAAEGRSWVELGEDGEIIHHRPEDAALLRWIKEKP